MRSSLGFHTLTLSLPLEYEDIPVLIDDFVRYSHNTGLIQIYHIREKGKRSKYKTPNGNTKFLPLKLQINYYKKDEGIKWMIRCHTWGINYGPDMVEITINPKILSGNIDYITAANYDDMNSAIVNCNNLMKQISPILKTFDCYELKRIDYCVNLDIGELVPGCSPELVMNLIRRSDIPTHYEEWTEYDEISHRKKSRPSSFYLKSPSTNINCYSKYMQLQEHSRENEDKGYPPIPQSTLDAAKNIIRFEIQCKYHKTYILSDKAKLSGNKSINKFENLLSDDTCNDIIVYYFKKIIMRGDWYTLQEAVRIIERQNYNRQKEKRLIDALELVSHCRSLAKAKTAYQGEELSAFKRTLKDLSSLNINPVTIPREWGIKHIPNLLYTYFDKVQEENTLKRTECFSKECLEEALANKKERKWLFSRM